MRHRPALLKHRVSPPSNTGNKSLNKYEAKLGGASYPGDRPALSFRLALRGEKKKCSWNTPGKADKCSWVRGCYATLALLSHNHGCHCAHHRGDMGTTARDGYFYFFCY